MCAILSFFVEMQPRESQTTEVKKTFLFETVESISHITYSCTKHTIELKLFATAWSRSEWIGIAIVATALKVGGLLKLCSEHNKAHIVLAQNLKALEMVLSAFCNDLHAMRFHLMWLVLLCSVQFS